MTEVRKRARDPIEPRLLFFGSRPWNTSRYAKDSGCGHFGAGDFLDLAGRARSVIDLNALAEPQIGNVLLPRHLFGEG